MSETEDPRATDVVHFGRGGADGDVVGVDTSVELWEAEAQEPQGSSRVLAAADRHRASLLVGLGWVGVTALVVAALGLATGDDPPTAFAVAASPDESHGLSSDQAACFGFSRIESRVRAVLGSESPIGIGPERHTIVTEIKSLDALGADYPSADYRLVAAFAGVANASVRLSQAQEPRDFDELVVERFNELTHARDACRSITDFDTGTASVREGE